MASTLCVCLITSAPVASADEPQSSRTLQVSGTGMDLLNGALVHSKESTPTGEVQRSTEIVVLEGDLKGRVLYHVTTVIDTKKGTLVNTGNQVFSGTVLGSEPVMLLDSKFRFDVNLKTGAESGLVFLDDHIAGPPVQCDLKVTGTGKTADGNPKFSYTGTCTFRGRHRKRDSHA
jgi:hypothetical protein